MLIRLRFEQTDREERTIKLNGDLPKAGSAIEIEDLMFSVSAIPTTWIVENDELVPVLHLLPKDETGVQ